MIYHVLPGDSLVEEFKKADIEGETIICRECLIVGPVTAETPDEFWDARSKFILTEYAEDEIEFHEKVADELVQLDEIGSDDEVNLWFEYELFCQVNMWFCISRLSQSGAAIYRVAPVVVTKDDRWKGFGGLTSAELKICYEARTNLSAEDISLGSDLWENYRSRNAEANDIIASVSSRAFPYLDETAAAAAVIDTEPARIINEIRSEGIRDFDAIFLEFSKRAGVYGLGDLQVSRMIDQLGIPGVDN